MKRLISGIAAALCLCTTAAPSHAATRCDEPMNGAHLNFEKTIVDLGRIEADAPKRSVELVYTSDGTAPLVVTEARTGCSCVTASYKRGKVMPGQKGTISVTLDPAKAPEGKFFRVIQVFSNSPTVARITVKAEITK